MGVAGTGLAILIVVSLAAFLWGMGSLISYLIRQSNANPAFAAQLKRSNL